MIADTKLRGIIGQPMSAVSFVHDYVEFHFDGKILRALARPSVHAQGQAAAFPEPGSRDALCSLIGKSVVNVIVREGESIEVRFDGSAAIKVPLSELARTGPEAAHFVSGNNQPIEVW
jgi:hypothetical protein